MTNLVSHVAGYKINTHREKPISSIYAVDKYMRMISKNSIFHTIFSSLKNKISWDSLNQTRKNKRHLVSK